MMECQGFMDKVEFDDEAGIFHGEIISTRDVLTFQGKSVSELTRAYRDSIDDYLEFRRERGEVPEKPIPVISWRAFGRNCTASPASQHGSLAKSLNA
jgi:predicted HicB family RNase H-like nuclease